MRIRIPPDSDRPIVYSFRSEWMDPIKSGAVSVFFRSKSPLSKPKCVFIYIGNPVKSIIGKAKVVSISRSPRPDALRLAARGSISESDLDRYIGTRKDVGVITIDDLEIFEREVSADSLSAFVMFHPPQNFQTVSEELEETIYRLANGEL